MGLYLVDTSAWILHFASKSTFDLTAICPPAERVLCLPIYQEILQGIREESVFRDVKHILDSARFVENPMGESLYVEAIALYRLARRQGLTIRSSVDCLIAECALRHDFVVLHHDRDFPFLAKVSPLREQSV